MPDAARPASTPAPGSATLPALLERMQPEFAKVLPDPERIARVALTEVRRVPKLASCTPASFIGAVMTCAQLGLEPGLLGEVYLIPRRNEVTMVIGPRGWIKMAMGSGEVLSIDASEVYEGDEFNFELGTNPFLRHQPTLDADPGPLKCFYAVALLKSEVPKVKVLPLRVVEDARKRSQTPNAGPWVSDYEAMGCKTAIKRLVKTLPMSTGLAAAFATDETVRHVSGPADFELTAPELEVGPDDGEVTS